MDQSDRKIFAGESIWRNNKTGKLVVALEPRAQPAPYPAIVHYWGWTPETGRKGRVFSNTEEKFNAAFTKEG